MTSTRISAQKAIAVGAICLSTVCLAPIASMFSFVSSASAQYGLGLPKSAGTGGATRTTDNLPQITMLVPEDGAKTLSARPTLYWYIAPTPSPSTSNTSSKVEESKSTFKIKFFLRDSNIQAAKPIYVVEGEAEQIGGLYKFTLPETAPELVTGKAQRMQIRWNILSNGLQIDLNAIVRRDNDPVILKAIAGTKNELEKARIYAKNAYWYDAIDAYTSWLSLNPKDEIARKERSDLLTEGFKNHSAFSKEQQGNIVKLLSKLDQSKSATSIALQPKIRP
ncbi:DUF928 domain-containing protein [Pseudanabaena sp. FACHB-1998]|uniref:DUF928 domain-containing protein n=1 Tax=Pseudanabaena sp. FACHB-1998 TaxID=2692858 RepID=UPI0016808118|nr:DUF928 domain-containing protein [Pseudanabaena sp. FACHB-1998]MBD2176746.1 DUF928 domain-containing protein [Pseudanabaena sp. FACHB-1998]